jgi:hypothetical protein
MRTTKAMRDQYRSKYTQHKHAAKQRGIPFLLTLDQWLNTWINSGHLHERGCGVGKYCMGRVGDQGPYAVDNVKILPFGANVTQYWEKTPQSEVTRQRMSNYWRLHRKVWEYIFDEAAA